MRAVTRCVALVAVVSLCLMGLSGVASASKNPVGSAKWCQNHPHSKLAACKKTTGGGGGGGSGGGGGGLPAMSVTVSPSGSADPLVETGESEVRAVVEVETSPLFFDDEVSISSLQLANVCGGAVLFGSLQPGAVYGFDSVEVLLGRRRQRHRQPLRARLRPGAEPHRGRPGRPPLPHGHHHGRRPAPGGDHGRGLRFPGGRGGDGQHQRHRDVRRLQRLLRGDRSRLRRAARGHRLDRSWPTAAWAGSPG